MNRSDRDIGRLISDHHSLQHWKNHPDIRKPAKQVNSKRLLVPSFDISLLTDWLQHINAINTDNIKILFAHFAPFDWELEALGLPAYTSKLFPNSDVDMTYDKGGKIAPCFRLSDNSVFRRQKIEDRYDLIIARSTVLNGMMNRSHDRECVKKSGYIVNIKTMSYSLNYQHADYYFDEEAMCPPPDPVYVSRSSKFLESHHKEKLIAVSGTLWYVKNQLKMFQQLDPSVIKDYRVVILGPERDAAYVKGIIDECDRKSIPYYLIGNVCRDMANDIKTLSKISLIPMDMRAFGQPKGYPRTLGESIGSRCLTLCNSPVTIPRFYKNTCRVYEESVPNDLNEKLQACIEEVSSPEFVKKHNWGEQSFEDVCESTIVKCLKLAGLYE
jgi:hypothetical protein